VSGAIILLNGASSSGKSTLARALQARIEAPFWHWSIDHIRDAGVLPLARYRSGEFRWAESRPAFFDARHESLPVLARAGNNLIVEHIVETPVWLRRLARLLKGFDVFFVGVHCPLDELERREAVRGDRPRGDARRDFATIHAGVAYDFEIDMTAPTDRAADAVLAAWRTRTGPGALARLG
jgi:chloramphenicol 3-O phosphotransferase